VSIFDILAESQSKLSKQVLLEVLIVRLSCNARAKNQKIVKIKIKKELDFSNLCV
jgi:hypothetical protein